MNTAIYFQVLSETGRYTYEKPVLNLLKQHFPQLVLFDFDTQSDSLMAGYASDLLDKAGKAVIILEMSHGPATGLIAFIEKVIAYKNKCLVLLYGSNDLVERMLRLLDKEHFIYADTDPASGEKAIVFLSEGGQ